MSCKPLLLRVTDEKSVVSKVGEPPLIYYGEKAIDASCVFRHAL